MGRHDGYVELIGRQNLSGALVSIRKSTMVMVLLRNHTSGTVGLVWFPIIFLYPCHIISAVSLLMIVYSKCGWKSIDHSLELASGHEGGSFLPRKFAS